VKALLTPTEFGNGFANRFLWAWSERSKRLPFGGQHIDRTPWHQRLADALAKARSIGEVSLADDARSRWAEIYDATDVQRPGRYGEVTTRGVVMVLRLALIYALADASDTICPEHLDAAFAVWQYCEASARYVFADTDAPSLADTLVALIRQRPGISRSDMLRCVKGFANAIALETALNGLQRRKQAYAVRKTEGVGRPAERWYPGEPTPSPSPSPTASNGEIITSFPKADAPQPNTPPLSPSRAQGFANADADAIAEGEAPLSEEAFRAQLFAIARKAG
jgi:hypothetical protein